MTAIPLEELRVGATEALSDPEGEKLFAQVHAEHTTTPSGISLGITRPKDTQGKTLPVILFIHGGGWVLGDENMYKGLRAYLTLHAKAAVVFVNYTLSPEVKYPIPLEECYDVLSWIVDTDPSVHQMDPTKIAVIGDSSGGNLTAALSVLDKQRRGTTVIKSLVLYYPALCATNFETDSYQVFSDGYFLTKKAMQLYWNWYLPDDHDEQVRLLSTVSPLHATVEELKDTAPALIITAEADVLRDDGEAYARKLISADVPVVAIRALGTIHGFLSNYANGAISFSVLSQTIDYLHRQWSNHI
ncbi:Alpha/Beta hydrolase protein [Zychaea mexicana]|uniref:Alpha/Beta hydrolase protein n=1 Tax=Zychaea mexicana TaxID=64656 RepID=UPI0022FEEE4E|nr:Alpha/Beta hydrolase protein [Zychaea mexicana]KAI9495953.1 Alpha/Beta hydrolase protein [Zychaea mexicana]